MKGLKLFTAAVAALALLAMPAGALAKRGDRDRDRMPDRWEVRHHLNPHANDARKDPDHDGLSNLSEFRHHTDPQSADTDDDSIGDKQEIEDGTNPDDANEISGTVQSFDGTTLVIKLPGDNTGTVSGSVTQSTEVECDNEDNNTTPTATMSEDGGSGSDDGDNSGSGSTSSGSDDGQTTTTTDNSGPGSTTSGDDDGDNDNENEADDDNAQPAQPCTIAVGDFVHEAKFTTTDAGNVFTKVELRK